MEILDCRDINKTTVEFAKKFVYDNMVDAHLAIIQVGNRPDSNKYVSTKLRMCAEVGIRTTLMSIPINCTADSILDAIRRLNRDNCVTGIMVQLPLPDHLDEKLIVEAIDPRKDVDCLTSTNIGKLSMGIHEVAPCTPSGIIEYLTGTMRLSLRGLNALVIGRSDIVGKPMAMMLTNCDATVTLAHSGTANLQHLIDNSDIIVVAIGRPNHIVVNNPRAIIFDVGINFVDGKMCGDVNLEDSVFQAATPVPFGVGQLTTSTLIHNVLTLATHRWE